MRTPLRAVLIHLWLLATPLLSAQIWNFQFGERFPLSNTRYGVTSGQQPVLVPANDAMFLFWLSGDGIRASRLENGESRNGRVVLSTWQPLDGPSRSFDVVWTGAQFVVAACSFNGATYTIVGQVLDANANAVGSPVVLASTGTAPVLAATGSSILLTYSAGRVQTRAFSHTLVPISPERTLSDASPAHFDAASNGTGYAVAVSGFGRVEAAILDAGGNVQARSSVTLQNATVAVASDGTDYVMATTVANATTAYCLRANGAIESQTSVAGFTQTAPSATWTGDHYAIALGMSFPKEIRVIHVDREARNVLGQDARIFATPTPPTIATRAGRTQVAWGVNPVWLSDLPLVANEAAPATFAALDQTLLATASSLDATLVVWREGGVIRIGLRHRDGRWRESALSGLHTDYAVAASDGHAFILFALAPPDRTPVLLRLDANGTPLAQRMTMPIRATSAIWWDGMYAVLGTDENGLEAMFLPASPGLPSTPVLIRETETPGLPIERAEISTNGNDFYAIWEMPIASAFDPLTKIGSKIEGAPLQYTLERFGPANVAIASSGSWPTIAYRNKFYRIAYANGPSVFELSIKNDEVFPAALVYRGTHDQSNVRFTVIPNDILLSWLDSFSSADGGAVHRLRTDYKTAAFRSAQPDMQFTAVLPGGRAAYIAAPSLLHAPQHGSTHLVMAIGDIVALPELPAAPAATARLENDHIAIAWSAPPQNVEGYRVEYRGGDGEWYELERWFDPNERSTTFLPLRPDVDYAFRVRAWSSAGTGPYSEPATIPKPPRKRRAVR